MTQTCLDGIMSDVSLLVEQNMRYRYHCTVEALRAAGATDEILAITKSSLMPEDQEEVGLFEGLDTEYLQNSLFRNKFGLIVSECVYSVYKRLQCNYAKKPLWGGIKESFPLYKH